MRVVGFALGLILVLLLAGCGERPDTVRIDGSSTVFPIARAGLDAYMREFPDRRVVASSSGTGAGFQRFFRGETDVQNASRPIRADEARRAEEAGIEYIELPIAFDGLAIIANGNNDWLECLTVEQLRAIWERGSTVQRWSDIDPTFPNQEIRLYGRSPASGTFDYFTTAIMGQRGNIRDGYNASDTDNAIVQGVSRDRFGLAFFGLAYYEQNRDQLKLIGVDNMTGNGCVRPTAETIQAGTYQPLARPEFIYVNVERAGSKEVEPFVEYFIANGARFVRQAGYIPFSEDVYGLVLERFRHRITGSLFEGSGATVGVDLAELLSEMDRDEVTYDSHTEAPELPARTDNAAP